MSRAQHDQVIEDDEAETCPLCIEDFDLSDRNFRPCPCGYQICQFCYNNIKTTMNGLCPACRRVYDDKNIQWKVPSAEEMASYKETVAQQAKKKAAARQKEAQRREADSQSRKHLAGIRVRQKNLVYVTGMRPTGSPERLAEELRKPEYFGQYGKIVKVVVSKAKENHVGVYVTFENKDDARRCIESVDGSSNNENRLRAQYGTTKYCSAYLRGETCGNRQCMFLHEPGEENESFTRQDLSSMNVISTQSPQQAHTGQSTGPPPQPQPPPQQAPQYVAAASHANETQTHRENAGSPVDSSDGSALPSTASWAKMRTAGSVGSSSRRPSQAQSTESPLVAAAIPATLKDEDKSSETMEQPQQSEQPRTKSRASERNGQQAAATKAATVVPTSSASLDKIIQQAFGTTELAFEFDESRFSKDDLASMAAMPLLFDPQGGLRRHVAEQKALERRKEIIEKQSKSQGNVPGAGLDEAGESGSLQLGGDADDGANVTAEQLRRQQAIQSPSLDTNQAQSPGSSANVAGSRGMTPQQQQQLLLQQFKAGSPNLMNQSQASNSSGHTRQSSRFSFANDQTASANVKPVANPKLMSQQSSMMPPTGHFNQQQNNGQQFFSSGVQGPPPGLKATGTPPVSGGGMFGQGHGFATAGLSYGMGSGNRSINDEMMRELLRNRGGSAGSGQASDTGRRESRRGLGGRVLTAADEHADQGLAQGRMHQNSYGAQSQASGQVPTSVAAHLLQEDVRGMSPFGTGFSSPVHSDTRRSTPALPPGLPLPFGRLPPGPVDPEQEALPVMAELGRIKPSQMDKDSNIGKVTTAAPATAPAPTPTPAAVGGSDGSSENQRPGAKPKQEIPAAEKPIVAEKDRDSLAFPALPTPAKATQVSTGSVKKSKKAKASSQQASASEVKPASVKEVPSEEGVKVEQTKSAVEDSKKTAKKGAPGKIDTSAAQAISLQSPSGGAGVSGNLVQASEESSAPISSVPETPGQAESVSKKTAQPRTIRILGPQASESLSQASTSQKPVKEAGLTSATTPGTPKSDNNDMLSATDSMSRASSPPAASSSRVGSAPVRSKTKSQQKKERQERAKALEEREKEDVEAAPATAAPVGSEAAVQEPIVGRKKKTKAKKSAPAKSGASAVATAASTPVASRPASPLPAVAEKSKQVEMPLATPAPAEDEVVTEVREEAKKAPESKASEEAAAPSSAESEAARRAFLADLVVFLEGQGEADGAAVADFFRPAVGMLNTRWHDGHLDASEPPLAPQPPLTAEELAALDSGKAVRRGEAAGKAGSRLLVTPHTRKALRALSPELEDRVLALEHSVRSARGSLRYSHRARSEAARMASAAVEEMFKDAAAILTRPPTTASASAAAKRARAAALQQSRASRAGKDQGSEGVPGKPSLSGAAQPAYGDDALAYLNKFILPLPTNRVGMNGAGAAGVPGNGGNGGHANAAASNTPGGETANPMSAAIPRTYTTGDPTYSVSGVDVAASNAANSQDAGQGVPAVASQKSMQAVAAAAMALNASAASSSPGDLVASATAAAESLVHTLGEGKTVADIRREALGVAAAISQQAAAQAHKFPQTQSFAQSQGFPQSQAQLQQAQNYLNNLPQALYTANGGHGFARTVADAEQAMMAAKKEAEAYEKKLMGLVRRNRKAAGLQ